jgi:tetratricopeptide (TPR) repeat protein
MSVRHTLRAAIVAAAILSWCGLARAASPEQEFQRAGDLARRGDYPKAIAMYGELARSGHESASLYWNWAQASTAQGALGEALWALLRARELDPSDRAVRREIERLREGANLDRAEIAPDPLSSVARASRWFRLDLVAILLLVISLGAHAAYKWRRSPARLVPMAWTALVLGLVASLLPVAGSFARSTGAVVRRDAPLLDAASPTGEAVGTLREGEVVPILDLSGGYVRVEDSSGARGWAAAGDVRPIDARPHRAS